MEDDPLKFYLGEVASIAPLDRNEEADLLSHVQAQDKLAEPAAKRLVETNLALVVRIAERHCSTSTAMLDLVQEGNQGLLRAIQTFTGIQGFSAYVQTCVEETILKAMRSNRKGP